MLAELIRFVLWNAFLFVVVFLFIRVAYLVAPILDWITDGYISIGRECRRLMFGNHFLLRKRG